jgi:hypothetical protein
MMKPNAMRLAIKLASAIYLVSIYPVHAVTLMLGDNLNPQPFALNPGTSSGASKTAPLPAGSEIRWIDPSGNDSGGTPGSTYSGGETWTFGSNGTMTGVGGTPSNTGALQSGEPPGNGLSAAPDAGSNPAIGQAFDLFNVPFNFLAPTTSSLAGAAYQPAQLELDLGAGTISVLFPVLEGQWVADGTGWWFPLGSSQTGTDTPGVLFSGMVNPLGGGLFSFRMQAQETINDIPSGNPGAGIPGDEDPTQANLGGWTVQWEVVGTFNAPVPLPASLWLFGSGLAGLYLSARRMRRRVAA